MIEEATQKLVSDLRLRYNVPPFTFHCILYVVAEVVAGESIKLILNGIIAELAYASSRMTTEWLVVPLVPIPIYVEFRKRLK